MSRTKDLSNKELRKRIHSLKTWKVKGSNESIKEYCKELDKRKQLTPAIRKICATR